MQRIGHPYCPYCVNPKITAVQAACRAFSTLSNHTANTESGNLLNLKQSHYEKNAATVLNEYSLVATYDSIDLRGRDGLAVTPYMQTISVDDIGNILSGQANAGISKNVDHCVFKSHFHFCCLFSVFCYQLFSTHFHQIY